MDEYLPPNTFKSYGYNHPVRLGKKRAGITKNKRQGQPKSRRKMAARSRKINRT